MKHECAGGARCLYRTNQVPYAPEARYVVTNQAIKIINFMKGYSLNIEPGTTYCS